MEHDRTLLLICRRIVPPLIIIFLLLAMPAASRAPAQERPSSRQEVEKTRAAMRLEFREAERQQKKIEERLRELKEERRAPQRKRSIQEIGQEHDSLLRQMEEQQRRMQQARERHIAAVLKWEREQKERASGLRAVPPDNRIRADFGPWRDQGQAAARAFCAKHPKLRFFRPDGGAGFPAFRAGHVDLLGFTNGYQDHFGGGEKQEFEAAFPQPPESATIGFWPLVVAVAPANPITRLTLDQLRKLASDRKATWKDLGRPKDGLVQLHLSSYQVAAILTGDKGGSVLNYHRASNRPRPYMDQILKAVADDPDALLMWHYTGRIAASGLKVLPIVDSRGQALLPSDLPAVASGRYVLRTPLTFIVHPRASAAARQFAQWLTTEEAAQAIAADRSRSHPADVPFLAHVTLAAKDARDKRNTTGVTPPREAGASAGTGGVSSTAAAGPKIDGAVAVMPTEPLSMYFLMAGPSHQAAYEGAVAEAIRRDGRLKLIDRERLARLLEERKLTMLQSPEKPSRAIVAADVFVFSFVVSDGARAFLQVSAVHGPTASVLGELKLPIDPADPGRFQPPLGQTLTAWWPRVLGRLDEVRHKPRWALVDVYTGSVDLEEAAYAEIASYGLDNWIYTESPRRGMSFAEPIDARERFLARFPQSKHARHVLADYTGACMNLAGKGKIPPGLDQRSTRLKYYRKGIEGCRQYIAEYTLQGKQANDWPKFMPSYYLYWRQKYVNLADPPEAECQAIVKQWSESYDTHLDQVPHSDFVRLIVLAQKEDRPGYDPNQARKLRRPVSLNLYCRGCRPPMQALVQTYHKRQTGLEFGIDVSPDADYTFGEFVRGRSQVYAYCGALGDEEQRLLKMMPKGPPTKVLLGYRAPKPHGNHPAHARGPLVFLAQPEPSEAVQDFLKWLSTAEARGVLKSQGVTDDAPSTGTK